MERHEHLRQRVARVVELDAARAVADLSPEERWEYLCAEESDPERDLMPLIEEMLRDEPDHLPALFRRGRMCLERGDEGGADLEQVVASDVSATLPACELAWRFFRERDAEGDAARADFWQQRYLERSRYEQMIAAEFAHLPADVTLAPHELDEDRLRAVCEILDSSPQHVRQAFLLRRVLKSDPSLHDYVLCIETPRFTLGDKGPAVIKRLAALQWPLSMFIVHLGNNSCKRFRKTIREIGVAPLEIARPR